MLLCSILKMDFVISIYTSEKANLFLSHNHSHSKPSCKI